MDLLIEPALTAAARVALISAAGLIVVVLAARAPVRSRLRLAGGVLALLPLLAVVPLVEPMLARPAAAPAPLAAPAVLPPSEPIVPAPVAPAPSARSAAIPSEVATVLVGVWLAGSLLAGLLLLVRSAHWLRWRRTRPVIADGALLAAWVQACRRAGLSRRPPLLQGAVGHPVFLVGIFGPALVVPKDLAETTDAAGLDAMFAHEIAHLRRHDLARAMGIEIVRALFWWNPCVHALAARVRDWTEIACDLAAAGADRRGYARALLHEAERVTAAPLVPACAFLRRPFSLETRIKEILNERPHPMKLLRLTAAALLAAATVSTFAVRLAVAADSSGDTFRYAIPSQTTEKKPWPADGQITITEVRGDRPTLELGGTYSVKGRYKVRSGEDYLYLGITPFPNEPGVNEPADPKQQRAVSGEGDFELQLTASRPGQIHLTLYDPQSSDKRDAARGGVYLGNIPRPKDGDHSAHFVRGNESESASAMTPRPGQLVTIAFTDTPTAAAIVQVSEKGGLKAVFEKATPYSRVSLNLTDMPVPEALEYLAQAGNVSVEIRGDTVHVGPTK